MDWRKKAGADLRTAKVEYRRLEKILKKKRPTRTEIDRAYGHARTSGEFFMSAGGALQELSTQLRFMRDEVR